MLAAGRLIRRRMLMGPEGRWRSELWLDDLLDAATPAAEEPPTKPVLTTPLPINTCTTDSLTLLPGVGPVLAGRIATARDSGVVFKAARDLCCVKGIGPVLSARLAPYIVFGNGGATGNPETPVPGESR